MRNILPIITGASLALSACGEKKVDESIDAICEHAVKISEDGPRLASKLELKTACEEAVEGLRKVASKEEFSSYAKCMYGTKNTVDLKDCYAPYEERVLEASHREQMATIRAMREIQEEIRETQLAIDDVQAEMDEAFKELEAAQDETGRQQAIAKREEAKGRMLKLKEKLREQRERDVKKAAEGMAADIE
mgnify:CR=1 FL=1